MCVFLWNVGRCSKHIIGFEQKKIRNTVKVVIIVAPQPKKLRSVFGDSKMV